MQPMLNIAVRAARNAGNIIIRYVERTDTLSIRSKGRNDFVTEVDQAAEQEIIHTLRKAYPNHGILAEESGTRAGNDYLWIIDPLDGTTNFLHGFPVFAVSIALQYRGRLELAVVYDPMRQELFTGIRGSGARLDDRRIRVSRQSALDGALLGTGFPFREQARLDLYLRMFKALFIESSGIRRAGAAALDLAYVAAGRLDGFWEMGLQPWDMAAGALLIQEAGGIVTNLAGEPDFLDSGNILTGTPKIHSAIYKILQPFMTPDPKQ